MKTETLEVTTMARQQSLPKRIASSAGRYAIIWICLALFIILSFTSRVFFSHGNLVNLLDQWSTIGIVACAGTFVLIARMFDLSVGATYALAGVVSASIAVQTGSTPLAFAAGLLAGVVVGLVNGVAVAIFNINPFIATLATSLMVTGIAIYLSGGVLISVTDPSYSALGRGSFLTLTIPGVVLIVTFLVSGFVLSRTLYGRRIYAVGGSPEAARLSGIRVNAVHISVFMISGFAAALAGVIASSRVSSGQADVGASLPLIVIAAVVVGGTSIFGGEGAMWRTAFGLLLYAMIGNGFTLLNINSQIQQVVQGLVLLIAVGLDAYSRKRAR